MFHFFNSLRGKIFFVKVCACAGRFFNAYIAIAYKVTSFWFNFINYYMKKHPLLDNTQKSALNMAVMVIAVILYIFKNN